MTRRRLTSWVLAVIATGLAVMAVVAYSALPRPTGDVAASEEALVASSTTATSVTETSLSPAPTTAPATSTTRPAPQWEPNPPAALTRTEVPPRPVRLRVDRLDVDAPIEPYGVDRQSGQMGVPDNVEDVGWYRHGPTPGEPGSAVLAAHVDLAGPGRGVFFHLEELEAGDRIAVEFDDGTIRQFRVQATTTYRKEELPLDVVFARQGEPTLTLITCGGGFSRSERSYDSNVVVFARPTDGTEGSFRTRP